MPGKPFLYSTELKQWDIVTIVIYVLFTLSVFVTYSSASANAAQITLLTYVVLTQLGIYFFLYGALRNFKLYLIWCGFGILHVIMYFIFRGNPKLDMVKGNPSFGLLNTIILLLLFQLLRFLSIKIQIREFVAPSKGGNYDIVYNVKVSNTDKILFFIYIGSWFGLSYIALLSK
jgi:hypothetical protein